MKLGAFLLVKAVVSLGFGIAFAALPAPAMSLFGVTLDASGALMARFVGAWPPEVSRA